MSKAKDYETTMQRLLIILRNKYFLDFYEEKIEMSVLIIRN